MRYEVQAGLVADVRSAECAGRRIRPRSTSAWPVET